MADDWGDWPDDSWGEAYAAPGFHPYDYSYLEGSLQAEEFEFDLDSLVFTLDENLEPQELFSGFEFDQRLFNFVLEVEDVKDVLPAAWKSRPLKIHPEPALRMDRKDSSVTTPAARAAADTEGGSPAANGLGLTLDGDTPKTPGAVPTQSSASGSPKIVINQSQLAMLRQKMLELKQTNVMPLPPAQEEKPLPVVPKPPTVYSNCPGNHGLKRFNTPEEGWWCSVCEKGHEEGAAFYGCRTCNYDECQHCALAERTRKAKAPQAPTPPAPIEPVGSANSAASSGDESSSASSVKEKTKPKPSNARRASFSTNSSAPKKRKSRRRTSSSEDDDDRSLPVEREDKSAEKPKKTLKRKAAKESNKTNKSSKLVPRDKRDRPAETKSEPVRKEIRPAPIEKRHSSEEAPKKRRAANALAVVEKPRGTSVSLVKARRSPEPSRAEARGGNDGDALLRSVLRARDVAPGSRRVSSLDPQDSLDAESPERQRPNRPVAMLRPPAKTTSQPGMAKQAFDTLNRLSKSRRV